MNPDTPKNHQPDLEVKLTALLLGELNAEEAAALEKAIQQDAELARLYERLKLTIGLVRETTLTPAQETETPPAALRLSDERRQKLLAHFKTIKSREFNPEKGRFKVTLVEMVAVLALMAVLAAMVLPRLGSAKMKAQKTSPQNGIVNDVFQLDSPQPQLAWDNNKLGTAPPALRDRASTETALTGAQLSAAATNEAASANNHGALVSTPESWTLSPQALGKPPVSIANIVLPDSEKSGATDVSRQRRLKPDFAFDNSGVVADDFGGPPLETATAPKNGASKAQSVAVIPIAKGDSQAIRQSLQDTFGNSSTRRRATPEQTDAFAHRLQQSLGGADSNAPNAPTPGIVSRGGGGGVDGGGFGGIGLQGGSPPSASQTGAFIAGTSVILPGAAKGARPPQTQTYYRSQEQVPTLGDTPMAGRLVRGEGNIAVTESRLQSSGQAPGQDLGSPGTVESRLSESLASPTSAQSAPAQVQSDKQAPETLARNSASSWQVTASLRGHYQPTPETPKATVSVDNAGNLVVTGDEAALDSIRRQVANLSTQRKGSAGSYGLGTAFVPGTNTAPANVHSANVVGYANLPASERFGTYGATTNSFYAGVPLADSATETAKAAPRGTARERLTQQAELAFNSTGATPSSMQESEGLRQPNSKKLELAENAWQRQSNERQSELDLAPSKAPAPPPVPQPEFPTRENAFSTFSLNVSDVSFKLAEASLQKGALPDAGSIRSEEFINAFDYRDPEPAPGAPIGFNWEQAADPFAHNRDLLRFSVKTAASGRQAGRPLNLVLLLDNSGSMERADRVRIIHEALRVLASQLQPQDMLSVVVFSRTAHLWVDGLPGTQAATVVEGLDRLTPQGGTNLEEAMKLAYATALRHYLANGINRVVLLTDGAANLGNVNPETLKQRVEANRKQGIALDCFGIGWEGYNDDLLEVLSRNGDGRYGFLNSPEEASTEFAGQLAGALHVAASDVKVQVEFNPNRVTSWRQIGYAKHQLTKEQFRDNTVDAAEIGAAESGNALYVIEVKAGGQGPLGTVRVRYKVPGTSDYREQAWDVPYTGSAVSLDQASPAMRLAATAAAFSEWLAASPYAGEVTPDRLLGYLTGVPEVYGADTRPKQLEWMIRQAASIAGTATPASSAGGRPGF